MIGQDLWAKSGSKRPNSDEPKISVYAHCDQVRIAADAIWDAIEEPLVVATGKPLDRLREMRPLLSASAMLHDVMKANSAFQAMLSGQLRRQDYHQPVWHEVLAAVFLTDDRFWGQWFARSLDDKQRWMVAWTVAGHHLRVREKTATDQDHPLFRSSSVPRNMTAYLSHEQVKKVLAIVRQLVCEGGFDPGEVPSCEDLTFDILDDDAENGLAYMVLRFIARSRRLWRRWQRDDDFKRDLAVLKALLIAADVAGSALPTEIASSDEWKGWISEQLGRTLNMSQAKQVYEDNLDGRIAHDFQQDVAASDDLVTVVTAGCGNGKTTAAYMWAERWASNRKLFFTYPTTGTASAGFKDYLLLQPIHRRLIHGRDEVDLAAMLASEDDVPPIERAQRLESLNAWGQQAIACTVDTVLGLVQNQRRPLFAFPAILRGAFVFDEVHSYDKRMFAELLRFLKTFPGLPTLIMSASIPPKRLEALQEAVGDRMNAQPIRGERKLEEIKRYRLRERSREECWREVAKRLNARSGANSHKVLWVCNTVGSAVAAFNEAKKRFPNADVLLYHSRYRYRDRVCLQDQVIDEFAYKRDDARARKHPRSSIAITTQVCEMSLDISADLLVTACCPLPSLVQRLGRLNRYATADDPWPAYVYESKGRPYHENDAPVHVEKAMEMVQELEGKDCNQSMLAEYVNNLQSNEELPEYSGWLDGGWQSEPLPAREGDHSITVVRAEDIEEQKTPYKAEDVIPLTIPMLFKRGFTWSRRAKGYPIAEGEHGINYEWDESGQQRKGASWRKVS